MKTIWDIIKQCKLCLREAIEKEMQIRPDGWPRVTQDPVCTASLHHYFQDNGPQTQSELNKDT